MALSIVHNKVATLPDEAGAEVNKAEWNADHNVAGTVDVADITGLGTLATQNGTFSGTSSGTNTGDQVIPPAVLVYANTTVPAGNTIASSNTETAFASTYTIAANTLAVGKKIKVKAWGVYGTDLIAPTLQGRLRFGGVAGTLMLDTGAISSIAGVTNGGWWAEAEFIVQTIGATGTIESQGYAEFATAATTGLSVNLENIAPITVDTTADKAIAITIQWGTADADNTITLRVMSVEIM